MTLRELLKQNELRVVEVAAGAGGPARGRPAGRPLVMYGTTESD